MNARQLFGLITSVALFVIIWYFVFPWLDKKSGHDRECDSYQNTYNESFKGMVKRTFAEKVRGGTAWNVVYTDSSKGELIRDFPEFVGLYAFVGPGDSIIKNPKTTYCRVYSVSLKRDSIFGFENHCSDSLQWRKK